MVLRFFVLFCFFNTTDFHYNICFFVFQPEKGLEDTEKEHPTSQVCMINEFLLIVSCI